MLADVGMLVSGADVVTCIWFTCDKMLFFTVRAIFLPFTIKKLSKDTKKEIVTTGKGQFGATLPVEFNVPHAPRCAAALKYSNGSVGSGTQFMSVSLCCRRANCTDPLHLSLTLFAPPANIPPLSLPPPLSHDLHGLRAGPLWSAHAASGFYLRALALALPPKNTA